MPSDGHCALFALPQESYIDYQPNNTLPEQLIRINQKYKQSKHVFN